MPGDADFWLIVQFVSSICFLLTKNYCMSCAFTLHSIQPLPPSSTSTIAFFYGERNEEYAMQGIVASIWSFELLIEGGTSAFISWLSPHLKTRGQEWTEGLMHFVSVETHLFDIYSDHLHLIFFRFLINLEELPSWQLLFNFDIPALKITVGPEVNTI